MFTHFRSNLKVMTALGLLLSTIVALALSPAAGASAAGLTDNRRGGHSSTTSGNPNLKVTIQYGNTYDSLVISGSNFPPDKGVRLVLIFSRTSMTQLKGWKADSNGKIDVTREIAKYPVGTRFRVVAIGPGGLRKASGILTVSQ
jgi:hypothetical protein